MKIIFMPCFYAFMSLFFNPLSFLRPLFANPNAEEWVKKADAIRNPSESFEMTIQVQGEDDKDNEKEVSVFDVFIKGADKTLIVTRQPQRDKGRNMLMLDRDFHAYIPNLKRSMRLSLAQKLSGQVANGDISRTRWAGDYAVTLENDSDKEIQLLLKANKENLTYAWIRLWVDKTNDRPLRTEYLGANGSTILKKAFFENYKPMAGAIRPSEIRIEDTNKKTSTIKILEMKSKVFDDAFFSIRNMESLK